MNSKYTKAIVAVIVSFAGALVVALGTGTDQSIGNLDAVHWLLLIGTVLGSGGIVWFTQNVPGIAGGVIKAIVAFLSAGIAALVTGLNDGHLTQAEYLTAFIAAVTATGLVYQYSNKGDYAGKKAVQ